jgi:hypothetical protein
VVPGNSRATAGDAGETEEGKRGRVAQQAGDGTMRALWPAVVVALGLAGCAGPALERGDALSGTCQFKPCVCADETAPFWRKPATADLLWSERGVPSCPPGFALQRTDESR